MIAERSFSIPSPGAMRLRAGDGPQAGVRRTLRAVRSLQASGAAVTLFTAVTVVTVAYGWLLRDRIGLTPRSGPGYALGIAGGSALLLLCVYPVMKRVRVMRQLGSISHWFRLHMILGVIGPVLILFHCDFHLGAANSNVALFSMLIVAASGVVGRYIYTRISHGLYGARVTFAELHAQLDVSAHTLGEQPPPTSRASQRLAAFATSVRAPHRSASTRVLQQVGLPFQAIWVRRRVLHDLGCDLASEAARAGWDARTRRTHEQATRKMIGAYIAALVKEAQFSAYERLFSLWHALHIPLFIMLVLTGGLHVLDVHMY